MDAEVAPEWARDAGNEADGAGCDDEG